MIELISGRRIFVHREPVDMRKAFDGLTALATAHFKRDVLAGDVFVFVGRDRKRIKAVVWDGSKSSLEHVVTAAAPLAMLPA